MTAASELLGGSGDPAYWVSGTTYAIGKTVRSPTDHQRYVRIVAGAGTTDPASDTTNWRPDGGRAIRSIQRGVTTSTGSPMSITIAAVNTAKTELRFLGNWNSALAAMQGYEISLSSSTTITVGRLGAGMTLSWELTEFY